MGISSVVVASNRDSRLLDACLASLEDQCRRAGAELIVARPADATPHIDVLRRRHPYARFVAAPPGSDVPRLRGAGLTCASGPATALTEDHCVADAGWVDALSAAMSGADVAGGGMGNARGDRAVDWGAYFSEYGFFSWARPTLAAAPGPLLLTGANVAYSASVRGRVAAWALDGVWENIAHARLHAEGAVLRFTPAARILQNKEYDFIAFCRDRYEHGRDYARTRLVEDASVPRWLLVTAWPLLGVLLTARVARASAAVDKSAFVRALPYTTAFLTSWSLGEAIGYIQGAPPTLP